VIRDGYEAQFTKSQAFSITQLGDFRVPEPRAGLPQQVFQQALNAQQSLEQSSQPPAEVLRLVEEREVARQRRAWAQADALRAQIAALGWQVVDTQDGSVLERVS
jgi:cysteinyl-tRNA synthetase